MKKFEWITGLICLVAIILSLLRIPGSGILALLSFTTLATFYYLFSFAYFNNISSDGLFTKAAYKNTNAKRIIGTIGLGWALSILIIGALFKLKLWPGASMMQLTGLLSIGVILIIALAFYFRNKSSYYTAIFKRIAIYGVLSLVLYLTPAATLVDIYYRHDPDYAALYKKAPADPNNAELQQLLMQKQTNPE